jgi:hypothetical protein
MSLVQADRARPVSMATVSADLVRDRALSRVVRWQPAVLGCALGWIMLLREVNGIHDEAAGVGLLRATGAAVVLGTLFVLDDPAQRFIEPLQMTARYWLAIRLTIALGFVAIGYTGASVALSASVDVADVAGVALELVSATLLGLAVAAVMARWQGIDEPGVATAPVLVAAFIAAQFLPQRFALVAAPGPDWTAAHARWAVLLVGSAVCLAFASRDRAAHRHPWQNH